MRAYLPGYQLISPAGLPEALNLLATEPGVWQPFAGGTDLMVLLESGRLAHKNYLNIWNLEELRGIEVSPEFVMLGALTTYSDVQAHSTLQQEFPMLCQAASETGGLAIQNRGTIGGNIVNASPAADSPPALLAYDAEVELISTEGARWVSYHGFHTGYKETIKRPEELLARVRLPRTTTDLKQYYRKVGTRKAQAISKVCLAACAHIQNGSFSDLRLAFGSIAPIPLRCVRTESALRGAKVDSNAIDTAKAALAREISPIDDIRSTRNYRLRVSLNLLGDFLTKLATD